MCWDRPLREKRADLDRAGGDFSSPPGSGEPQGPCHRAPRIGRASTVVSGRVLLVKALVKGADPLVEGGVLRRYNWLDEPKLRTGVNRN